MWRSVRSVQYLAMRFRLIVVALLFIWCSQLLAQSARLVRAQELKLSVSVDGVDGSLELWSDARLTPEMRKEMWGRGDWSFVLDEGSPAYKQFKQTPPLNSEVRLLDTTFKLLDKLALDYPLAEMWRVHLHPGASNFFLTYDSSIGWGSYNGLSTRLLELSTRKLKWVESDHELIFLPRMLKSDWKIVRYKDDKDILVVRSHPAKIQTEGNEFVTEYTRFRFVHGTWKRYQRIDRGIWESDEGFPPLSKFP